MAVDDDGAFALRFARALRERFGIDAPAVAAALGGRALVAGSLPLQVELDETWPASDLDVYAHARDVPRVLAALLLHGDYEHAPLVDVRVGPYSSSGFLGRNRIKGLATLRKAGYPDVQVMAVRHDRPLQRVVEQFDLSPCAVACAFDGRPNFLGAGASREAVRARTGCLRDGYHSMYFNCNATLHARLAKYTARGFVLRLPEFGAHAAAVLALRAAVPPTPEARSARRAQKRCERFERVLSADAVAWMRSADADYIDREKYKLLLRKAFDETHVTALSYDSDDDDCVSRVAATALQDATTFAQTRHLVEARCLHDRDTRSVLVRNADAVADEEHDVEPPQDFVCPISRNIMAHPVRCLNHWYEWARLEAWFRTSDTSPLTREEVDWSSVLASVTSADALALHRRILQWRHQHRLPAAPTTDAASTADSLADSLVDP